MIDRFERFSLAISEINRCWHKIAADEMEKFGLKGPYATYLIALYEQREGVTAARLCEICGRDKADVSRNMAAMEAKGLVKKDGVNQNLYRGTFRLTDAGRTAAEHVRRRASLAVSIAGREMSEEKRAVFYEALGSVAANLKELSREGLPE